jgi:uncharacterized protein GlcG (DUF336 family)
LSLVLTCIALPASAQETVRIRGTIESVDGPVYVVKNRDGAEVKLTVTDNPLFVAIVKSTMADIKPGMFVGSTGMISIGKARTAARFRRESRLFYNVYEAGHAYTGTLDPTLVASPGGFPLVEDGKLIGAVGCSGGTGDQDATICKVGAEVVK